MTSADLKLLVDTLGQLAELAKSAAAQLAHSSVTSVTMADPQVGGALQRPVEPSLGRDEAEGTDVPVMVSSDQVSAHCVKPKHQPREPSRKPAAPPAPAMGGSPMPKRRAHRGHTWTPDRVDILTRDWPLGVATKVIHDRLMALPGDPILMSRICIYAASLNLRRPARAAPKKPPSQPLPPVEVSRDVYSDWAFANRMAMPTRLSAVNAARVARGLPPFVIAQ